MRAACCSTWGERAWEFAAGLIFLDLNQDSLLYVALFGLLDAATLVLFGAAVGAYVDRWAGCKSGACSGLSPLAPSGCQAAPGVPPRTVCPQRPVGLARTLLHAPAPARRGRRTPRLQAATRLICMQNVAVAVSALASLALLWGGITAGPLFYAFMALAMAAGSVSSLGSLGNSLSVEREWTKTLCGSDSEALARLNAGGWGPGRLGPAAACAAGGRAGLAGARPARQLAAQPPKKPSPAPGGPRPGLSSPLLPAPLPGGLCACPA